MPQKTRCRLVLVATFCALSFFFANTATAQAPDPATPVKRSSKEIIADAFQLDDPAKRDRAIIDMKNLLASKNTTEQLAGLAAFNGTSQVAFEKKPFRLLVLPLLESNDPAVRAGAAPALLIAGLKKGDDDRVATLTKDNSASVRIAAAHTLIRNSEKDLSQSNHSRHIATLLRDKETSKEVLQGLWGVKFSPEIEAEVLRLSNTTKVSDANTNDIAYTALYYALSTQPNKSEASVKRLIEYFAARDTHNIAGRAAWGLGQGVAPAQQDLVVKGALRFMEARTPPSYAFRQCLARVKQYSKKEHRPLIEKFSQKPALGPDLKKALDDILKNL